MSSTDLLSALERLGHPRVLVLGDLMLDRYNWGAAERVSQEAPVIVLHSDSRESRLGGAGNVANMLRGLEARVTCAGVVGDDLEGRELLELLSGAGIENAGVLVDALRMTTVKERFMGRAQGRHPHQMLRVDSEARGPLDAGTESQLIERIRELVPQHDVLLVSDYDKGACTPRVLRDSIDAAAAAGIPVLVDPIRSSDYSRYRGATTMTPNRTEAGMATGIRIETPDDALRAGRKLCRELKLEMAIITLDRDGMALVRADGTGDVFPTEPRAVYDITGAGDMVLAMLGVCFASDVTSSEALQLGNIAGGLEVEKVGVAVIPRAEIRSRLLSERPPGDDKVVGLDQLATLVAGHRASGEKIVLTNGCFDLLHVGHIRCLQEAARLGQVLVVGLNSDASVRRLKGAPRPVLAERDRAAMVSALGCVSYVCVFDGDTPHELIERLRPDVLVKGATYQPEQVVGGDRVLAYGGKVHITPMIAGISTDALLASLRQNPPGPPHFERLVRRDETAERFTTREGAA